MEDTYHWCVPTFRSRIPLLKATDEWVHTWYYDRQGGIRSHGLKIISNLPHLLVLLALQRLDMDGWRFAPNLGFDMNDQFSAQLEGTLHRPAINLEASIQWSAAIVKFTHDQVLQAHWGLVGRVMTVYESDYPLNQHVFKLSWPEASRALEPDVLKELGEIPDEAVKGHIMALLASKMPAMIGTWLAREPLGILPQSHFPEPRASRWLVIPVCQKRCPVWDLTADEIFNIWVQTLSCMLDGSVSGRSRLTHFRSHHSVGKRVSSPRYRPCENDTLLRSPQ